MVLLYYGISLANQIDHPLTGKIKYCSSEELSKVKIPHDEYCTFLDKIKALDTVEELSLISTCNRFEIIIYLNRENFKEALVEEIGQLIYQETGSCVYLGTLFDHEAKLQFLRTFSGLNSALIGENEVCTQISTSFRQAAAMGYLGKKGIKLLEDAIKLRNILDLEIYYEAISYCDVALRKALNKLDPDGNSFKKIVLFGSGNTTRKSCESLLKQAYSPKNITVIHRISCSSEQVENIKSIEGLDEINFVRSKHGYHVDKVKDILSSSDLLISGIDTKTPVIELPSNSRLKVIDFNSNPTCSFAEGFNRSQNISIQQLDNFVREFSLEKSQDFDFHRRIKIAENIIRDYSKGLSLV
jgi:glutamyl-tRNA reductase